MLREIRPAAVGRYLWEPASLGLGLILLTLIIWGIGDKVIERTLTVALINTVMVIGLYIFIGNSGVLAFGHMAFALIGAYAVAWFTMSPFKKSFALDLPAFLAEKHAAAAALGDHFPRCWLPSSPSWSAYR